MIKKVLLLFVALTVQQIYSQQIYLYAGKNFTSYDYTNSNGQVNPDVKSGTGSYYEIGYEHDFNKKISYMAGLTLNQFNAYGGNVFSTYSWKTNYLGIQNLFSYAIIRTTDELELTLKAGVNTATIIQGQQELNGVFYDLKNQKEFSGIVLQPLIGLNLKYVIADYFSLSLGYNLSKAFNISNSTNEKLSFNNNQLQFGLHFPL